MSKHPSHSTSPHSSPFWKSSILQICEVMVQLGTAGTLAPLVRFLLVIWAKDVPHEAQQEKQHFPEQSCDRRLKT